MKYSLALDLGATSIRGILGYIENGELKTIEVLRFHHKIIKENNRSYWDWDKIISKIEEVILKYGNSLLSIGVDTWGVDFGVLDKNGNLIEKPISYRDKYNIVGFKIAQENFSPKEIFMKTGNQVMPINTLFQILYLKNKNRNYDNISNVLMMPDLINYFLTGNKFSEITIASTTQLIDIKKRDYSYEIMEKYKINKSFFSKIIEPGKIIGNVKNSRIDSIRKYNIPVISVASHDTASAVLLTKAYIDKETLFLSCGTWSLIGCISEKPIITETVFKDSLTNEIGYNYSNMFFKNLVGLYVIEKLKTQLENKLKRVINFDEITNYMTKCNIEKIININSEVFQKDDYDVIDEINKLIDESLSNDFDYFKIIYLSLVYEYKKTIEQISKIVNRKFKKLHIIGGGAKSKFLCEMIVNITGLEVIAGPFESTTYGNLLIQKIALNEIKSLENGFDIINKSVKIHKY